MVETSGVLAWNYSYCPSHHLELEVLVGWGKLWRLGIFSCRQRLIWFGEMGKVVCGSDWRSLSWGKSRTYEHEAAFTVRVSIPSKGCTNVQLRPETAQAIHTLLDNAEAQKASCELPAGQTWKQPELWICFSIQTQGQSTWLSGKRICLQCRRYRVKFLGQRAPMEKERANHSCPYSCLGDSMDRGAWQATVYGVHKEPDTT